MNVVSREITFRPAPSEQTVPQTEEYMALGFRVQVYLNPRPGCSVISKALSDSASNSLLISLKPDL